jgi:hypothetical protein
MIGVALLSRLCDTKVLPNHMNLLLSFLQYVGSKNLTFSSLIKKQRSSASTSIQHLEQHHLHTLLITIVVGELSIRQTLIPTSSILHSTSSQHVFQNLIHSFGLSIGLRVISRTEAQLGIQGFMYPLSKPQSKLCPSVRHNLLWHSMQIDYPQHIQLY